MVARRAHDRHFPSVAEVHLIVVERAAHGAGIGTAMLSALETDARARGVRLLEETELWGEGTPCLIMVKPLPASRIHEGAERRRDVSLSRPVVGVVTAALEA